MFKPGDRVRCVDAGSNMEISNGVEYFVSDFEASTCRVILRRTASRALVDDGTKYHASRFVKVEEPMNNGVVELNGKKYKVEVIEGKGECLVPVQPTYGDLIGKVVQLPDKSLHLIQSMGFDRAVRVWLTGVACVQTYDLNKTIQFETVVADSLSEAIQKGLLK